MHTGQASDGFEFEPRPLTTVWSWGDAELIWESEWVVGIVWENVHKTLRRPTASAQEPAALSHLPSSWHLVPQRPRPTCPVRKAAAPDSVNHKGGTGWASDPGTEGLLALVYGWAQTPAADGRRKGSEAHRGSHFSQFYETQGGKAPSKGMKSSFCRMGGHSSQAGLGSDQLLGVCSPPSLIQQSTNQSV